MTALVAISTLNFFSAVAVDNAHVNGDDLSTTKLGLLFYVSLTNISDYPVSFSSSLLRFVARRIIVSCYAFSYPLSHTLLLASSHKSHKSHRRRKHSHHKSSRKTSEKAHRSIADGANQAGTFTCLRSQLAT